MIRELATMAQQQHTEEDRDSYLSDCFVLTLIRKRILNLEKETA